MEKPRHEGRNERGGEPKAWEGNGAKREAASRTRKGTEGTARCLSVYAPQGAPTRSGRRDERSENRRSVVRRHRAGSASGRRPRAASGETVSVGSRA